VPLLPDDFPFPLPLEDGYVRALDAALDRLGSIVREVVEAPGAVVFHCHSGTGRTGTLAAVLLAFAGVADHVVADDYLVSLRMEGTPTEDFEAARHVVPRLLAHLARRYGGPDEYLRRAGVEADLRQRLRTRLVG
jgi:protein-tyrosine phosphatase